MGGCRGAGHNSGAQSYDGAHVWATAAALAGGSGEPGNADQNRKVADRMRNMIWRGVTGTTRFIPGEQAAPCSLPIPLSWPALGRPPILQQSRLPRGRAAVQRSHDDFAYTLASKPYGRLTFGVTNELRRRVEQQRDGTASAFTRRNHVHRLVWFEHWRDIKGAIQRETSLKRWRRDWKINLLESDSPQWVDLYPSLMVGG